MLTLKTNSIVCCFSLVTEYWPSRVTSGSVYGSTDPLVTRDTDQKICRLSRSTISQNLIAGKSSAHVLHIALILYLCPDLRILQKWHPIIDLSPHIIPFIWNHKTLFWDRAMKIIEFTLFLHFIFALLIYKSNIET